MGRDILFMNVFIDPDLDLRPSIQTRFETFDLLI